MQLVIFGQWYKNNLLLEFREEVECYKLIDADHAHTFRDVMKLRETKTSPLGKLFNDVYSEIKEREDFLLSARPWDLEGQDAIDADKLRMQVQPELSRIFSKKFNSIN